MAYNLPSLNALRAFEAAARHGSFKRAAAELFVTPGAVSQQIKALEESLGLNLFRRLRQGIELTEAGRTLAPVLQAAFQGIADGLERIGRSDRAGTLTVSVLTSFAVRWLVPRLGRFRALHPEIDVRISASPHSVDFQREDVDVAIRHGLGHYPGLHSVPLLSEDLFPVCSPRLMEGPHPLREPADLRYHTLLHDETPRDWRMWLEVQGVTGVDPTRGPVFSDAAMVLQAAIEGQGVAITRSALVGNDLAEGRLLRPFALSMPNRFAYYLVCPEEAAQRPKIAAFRDWLLEEVARGPTGAARAGAGAPARQGPAAQAERPDGG